MGSIPFNAAEAYVKVIHGGRAHSNCIQHSGGLSFSRASKSFTRHVEMLLAQNMLFL